MDPSRFHKNEFQDYRVEFDNQISTELSQIKFFLESRDFFTGYLNQIDDTYPYNDVYVGKYGILLFYYFMQKKYPFYRDRLLKFYSTCIAKCDKRCHALISFHCGEAGIYAIESIIQHLIFNDQPMRDKYLTLLMTCVQDAINPKSKNYDELLYGRVSLLYALCFVENELGRNVVEQLDHVIRLDDCKRQVLQRILSSGVEGRLQEREPLFNYHYSWHGKAYTGAAHGYSGIYYLLLKNRQYCTPAQLNDLINDSIRLIQTQLLSNGNMTSKLNGRNNQTSSNSTLVQFCLGAPGFLFLLAELHAICQADPTLNQHLSLVQQTANTCMDTTWSYGILTKGMNLCHGVAGNGYAFLAWYRQTGDLKSLYRAIQFAKYCLNFNEQFMLSDRPFSLYEGLAGTIYFLVDILEPANARFPAFEL